jgi:hypothetical protein
VGEIALTAPRDAEPTAWADADEACGARKRNFNYSTNVHNVMFLFRQHSKRRIIAPLIHNAGRN